MNGASNHLDPDVEQRPPGGGEHGARCFMQFLGSLNVPEYLKS